MDVLSLSLTFVFLFNTLNQFFVFSVTDPEFRYFFSQFGELHESIVMFDRVTRRSRGFGFVTYVNPVSATTTCTI